MSNSWFAILPGCLTGPLLGAVFALATKCVGRSAIEGVSVTRWRRYCRCAAGRCLLGAGACATVAFLVPLSGLDDTEQRVLFCLFTPVIGVLTFGSTLLAFRSADETRIAKQPAEC